MSHAQQGDVKLVADVSGTGLEFSISSVNGVMAMDEGLATAVILSMFGGNVDDDGTPDSHQTWWGNLLETDPVRKYRGLTQCTLKGRPASSANLLILGDAVKSDLAWSATAGVANVLDVSVTLPALNRVKIVIRIEAAGEESTFTFTENWKAA